MNKYLPQYLNCKQVQYFLWFEKRRRSYVSLLAKSCEAPNLLFEHSVVNQKSKFDFINAVQCDDFSEIGISTRDNYLQTFDDAHDYMISNQQILPFFIQVNEFFMPSSQHYQKLHTNHSNTVIGFNGKNLTILDNVGANLISKELSYQEIKDGFDNVSVSKRVRHFELGPDPDNLEHPEFHLNNVSRLSSDNLTFLHERAREKSHLIPIGNFFAQLCGSRAAHLEYLSSVGQTETAQQLQTDVRRYYLTMTRFYAASLTGKVPRDVFDTIDSLT